MLRFFASTRAGLTPEAPVALRLGFGAEEIIVRPDDVLIGPSGARTLRSVRTGHQRSNDGKDVGAAAFMLAARQAFPGATAEIIYLSDEHAEEVSLSPKEIQNRHEKLGGFLKKIRSGLFPPVPSTRVCPGCPAFFICGPVPAGPLQKKFPEPTG
jgi:hypothetical protein